MWGGKVSFFLLLLLLLLLYVENNTAHTDCNSESESQTDTKQWNSTRIACIEHFVRWFIVLHDTQYPLVVLFGLYNIILAFTFYVFSLCNTCVSTCIYTYADVSECVCVCVRAWVLFSSVSLYVSRVGFFSSIMFTELNVQFKRNKYFQGIRFETSISKKRNTKNSISRIQTRQPAFDGGKQLIKNMKNRMRNTSKFQIRLKCTMYIHLLADMLCTFFLALDRF